MSVQKQQEINDPIILSIQPVLKVESQLLSDYLRIMRLSSIHEVEDMRKNLLGSLSDKWMISDEDRIFSGLNFKIVSSTPNNECLVLKVCLHRFTFLISLIFVKEESSAHQIHIHASGNFSTIYQAKVMDRVVAIKCTSYSNEDFETVFEAVLAEYLIFLVASSLGIGPKMEKNLGFDLIVYQDCIEFCMEYCEQNLQSRIEHIEAELIDGMKSLHSLSIIHSDIKPENICYSVQHKKVVFIDYGLHQIIDEGIGFKTLTSFQGSVAFSSPEMTQCFQNQDTRYIDLYFNDAYCLEKSLIQIKNDKCGFIKKSEFPSAFNLTPSVLALIFKAALVDANYISIKKENQLSFLKYQLSTLVQRNQIEDCQNFATIIQEQLQFSNINATQNIEDSNKRLQLQPNQFDEARIRYFKFQKQKLEIQSQKAKQQSFILNGYLNQARLQDLQNIQYCKNLQKSLYIALLSKYLQPVQWKIKITTQMAACNIFNELYLKKPQFSSLQIQEMRHICFKYCMDYALARNCLANIEFQIIKCNLLSAIIFQIYEQDEFDFLLQKIVSLEGKVLRKIRLFMNILLSLGWIKEKHTSKYNYYSLMDFVYGSCKEYLNTLDCTQLSKKQQHVISQIQILLINQLSAVNFSKILDLKLYLYQVMTDDYLVVLAEIQLFTSIKIIQSEHGVFSNDVIDIIQGLGQLIVKQQQFHLEEFSFITLTLMKLYLAHKDREICRLLVDRETQFFQNWELKRKQFTLMINVVQSCAIQDPESLQTQYKQELAALERANNQYRIATLNTLLYIKKNEGLSASISLTWKNHQLKDLFSIQKCMSMISQTLIHFHQHNLSFQILGILQIIRQLTIIDSIYSTGQIDCYYEWLYAVARKSCCWECKIPTLIYLLLYNSIRSQPIMNLKIEQNFLTLYLLLLRNNPKIDLICEMLVEYLYLIEFNSKLMGRNDTPYQYNYILLIYQTAIALNNFQIYFLLNRRGNHYKIIPIGSTLAHFWRMGGNYQYYFNFLDQICRFLNHKMYLQAYILDFHISIFNFLTQLDISQLVGFFKINYSFYIERLKHSENNLLAIYLVYILCTRQEGMKINSNYFLYALQYGSEELNMDSLYMAFLQNIKIDSQISKRRQRWLVLKRFKSFSNKQGDPKQIIRIHNKRSSSIHSKLFIQKLRRCLKNSDLSIYR